MAGRSKETRVDPELARQLEEAGPDDGPVQAVVYLRSSTRSLNPDSVTKAAERVIESASTKAGTAPARVNVMRYIGTVAVEGPASFVRALIDENDVTSALANVHPDEDPLLGTVSGGGTPGAAIEDERTDEETSRDDEGADDDQKPTTTRPASTRKTRGKRTAASGRGDAAADDDDRPAKAAKDDEPDEDDDVVPLT
jgi:hypothetical protein